MLRMTALTLALLLPAACQDFCGSSTLGTCSADDDCVTDGCSGEVCRSVDEEPIVDLHQDWIIFEAKRW